MADLNNLFAELDGAPDHEDFHVPQADQEEDFHRDYEYKGIPEVLKAAHEYNTFVDREKEVFDAQEDAPEMARDEDYSRLKATWIRELLCPELLSYDHETISLEVELIEGQEVTIESLSSTKNVDALMAQIYRQDVERTKYIVSDLLAARLDKLEEHALHNRTLLDRMSDKEVEHLKAYGELLENHFKRTVLNHLPKEAWKRLDDPEMIETPNLNQFLFCRTLEDIEIGDQHHSKGACLIARYGAIQKLVLDEKLELLM